MDTSGQKKQIAFKLKQQTTQTLKIYFVNVHDRDVLMENNKKTSVSRARLYTKLKKKLTDNTFVNRCHTCLSATMATAPYHERSM